MGPVVSSVPCGYINSIDMGQIVHNGVKKGLGCMTIEGLRQGVDLNIFISLGLHK